CARSRPISTPKACSTPEHWGFRASPDQADHLIGTTMRKTQEPEGPIRCNRSPPHHLAIIHHYVSAQDGANRPALQLPAFIEAIGRPGTELRRADRTNPVKVETVADVPHIDAGAEMFREGHHADHAFRLGEGRLGKLPVAKRV